MNLKKRRETIQLLRERGDLQHKPLYYLEKQLGIKETDNDEVQYLGTPLSKYYQKESEQEFKREREKTDKKVRELLKTIPNFQKNKGFSPFRPE